LAAVLPVAIRALNPKDPAFGIVTAALPSVMKFLADTQEASNKKATKKAAAPKKK
jgi:hypothetical protein